MLASDPSHSAASIQVTSITSPTYGLLRNLGARIGCLLQKWFHISPCSAYFYDTGDCNVHMIYPKLMPCYDCLNISACFIHLECPCLKQDGVMYNVKNIQA